MRPAEKAGPGISRRSRHPDRRLPVRPPLGPGTRGARLDRRATEPPGELPVPVAGGPGGHARAVEQRLPPGSMMLVDGLALGAMPALAAEAASRLDLVALVHHPLCLETGLAEAQAAALEQSERAALAAVRGAIVTSRTHGRPPRVPSGRARLAGHGGGTRHRPRPACLGLRRRGLPHAVHRHGDAPQRPGAAGAGAGRGARGMGACDRRQPGARHRDRGAVASRCHSRWDRRPGPAAGRARRGRPRRCLRRRRPVRLGVPLRGLRHGAGRGAGAWAADRGRHGWCGGRHGSGICRSARPARRRAGPCCGAAPLHRRAGPARSPASRRRSRPAPACRLGQTRRHGSRTP